MSKFISPQRALISVSDKSGIVPFAQALHAQGIEILSTGGTAKAIADAGIQVTDVSSHTGFPGIMDGRVKTLHPKVHGGILGRRGTDEAIMAEHDIAAIDLVVVNLYPFQQTIAKPDCSFEQAVEQIDIGGPAMLRAAAKNHASVAVIVDPADYDNVIDAIQNKQGIDSNLAKQLATKAFTHTAQYDAAISQYLLQQTQSHDDLPKAITLQLKQTQTMRYGENQHQQAGLYTLNNAQAGFTQMRQYQGKPLSYNNLADADAAVSCVREFKDKPACVIVKHANPCGVAQAESLEKAYEQAYATDPSSAFGGIIAFNQVLDEKTARRIVEQQFVEVIIAPEIDERALIHFTNKPNIRVLSFPLFDIQPGLALHAIAGGVLVQTPDLTMVERDAMKVATEREPSEQEWTDLLFAMRVVKHVKSNAIVYAKNYQTIGIGAGQTSRVASSQIAVWKASDAGLGLFDSVMASDAFFPFRDSIDAAAKAGIRAIIQPGGSKRDDEVIQAANAHDMAMVLTGMRHFKH